MRFRVEQVPKGLHFLKMFQTGRIEPPVKLSHTHTYTHVYIQYNIPTPSIYRLYISLNTKKVTRSSEMRSTSTQDTYIYRSFLSALGNGKNEKGVCIELA